MKYATSFVECCFICQRFCIYTFRNSTHETGKAPLLEITICRDCVLTRPSQACSLVVSDSAVGKSVVKKWYVYGYVAGAVGAEPVTGGSKTFQIKAPSALTGRTGWSRQCDEVISVSGSREESVLLDENPFEIDDADLDAVCTCWGGFSMCEEYYSD